MKQRKTSPSLSLVASLSWIVGSTVLLAPLSYKGIHLLLDKKERVEEKITYLIQTGPCKEALQSTYLCEILRLSQDRPISFASFDEKEARKRLLACPVIREASVQKIKPNMVYVDYTLHRPICLAADFVNMALSREGVLFPLSPFFSPKRLPEIYLGQKEWEESGKIGPGEVLQSPYLDLAFLVLDHLVEVGGDLFHVKRVDVSQAWAPTLGKREIVLVLEVDILGQEKDLVATHFLRLAPKSFREEIAHYLQLRESILKADLQTQSFLGGRGIGDRVIDLRLSQMAFITSS